MVHSNWTSPHDQPYNVVLTVAICGRGACLVTNGGDGADHQYAKASGGSQVELVGLSEQDLDGAVAVEPFGSQVVSLELALRHLDVLEVKQLVPQRRVELEHGGPPLGRVQRVRIAKPTDKHDATEQALGRVVRIRGIEAHRPGELADG